MQSAVVLRNIKAGISKILRNSLPPLTTFENLKQTNKQKQPNNNKKQGRKLNSETKC
jgi:hypothetical protein